jgi:DNA adenine methylase
MPIELAPSVKPFLKWAGGKTQLIKEIRPLVPSGNFSGCYFEPFMGSAALFFELRPQLRAEQVVLADSNLELVLTFQAVRDQLEELLEKLAEYEHLHNIQCRDEQARRMLYEGIRALDRQANWFAEPFDARQRVAHAARFIYLNKTCFNGLWRVNSQGFYNVPMGRYAKPTICNEALLRAASQALQGVLVECQPYWQTVRGAGSGDLVYFDPPYMPLSNTASFNAYAKEGFLAPEHRELAVIFLVLAKRGARVILSNSATAFTCLPLGPKDDLAGFARLVEPILEKLELPLLAAELFTSYKTCWQPKEVLATRAINSKGSARGAISELLVASHV